MQHSIPTDKLGPHGESMAHAVQSCVHCGFCLPACPTYEQLGEEMDSPRGRIFLMKEVLEQRLNLEDALPYIDRCLGCLGCVTACPSGVEYGELLTPFRAMAESKRKRSLADRLLRQIVLSTLPYPNRFRWAAKLGVWGSRLPLPKRLRQMTQLLPKRLPAPQPLPAFHPADGPKRGRVALIAGCAQQVLAPEINWATLRVLARNGIETFIPKQQSCCGALAAHTGAMESAKKFARHNIETFPDDVDAILTNAAGCGSGIHEYPLWLNGDKLEDRARRFASQARDVTSFLHELQIESPPRLPGPLRVAYHDACHLSHAQKVKSQPRSLLRQIENLELVEIPNGDLCCGSAGTYNIEQPNTANALGQQKADSIRSVQPDLVATGNIGCLTQMATHLGGEKQIIPVMHTIELLDRAYREKPLVG